MSQVQSTWRPGANIVTLLLHLMQLRGGNSDEGLPPETTRSRFSLRDADQTSHKPDELIHYTPDVWLFASAGFRCTFQSETTPLPHGGCHLRVQLPHKHTTTHTVVQFSCRQTSVKFTCFLTSMKFTCLLRHWWGVCSPGWTSCRWQSLRKRRQTFLVVLICFYSECKIKCKSSVFASFQSNGAVIFVKCSHCLKGKCICEYLCIHDCVGSDAHTLAVAHKHCELMMHSDVGVSQGEHDSAAWEGGSFFVTCVCQRWSGVMASPAGGSAGGSAKKLLSFCLVDLSHHLNFGFITNWRFIPSSRVNRAATCVRTGLADHWQLSTDCKWNLCETLSHDNSNMPTSRGMHYKSEISWLARYVEPEARLHHRGGSLNPARSPW